METKSIAAEVRDVDTKKGIVSMYVSSFDVIDSDNDKIIKGAFADTIKEWGPGGSNPRIKHLLFHDTSRPIGRPLSMKEDNYGLHVESLIAQTTDGKDTLKLYEYEVISEHSIGFQAEEKTNKSNYKEISKIKLFEYSSVLWGANEYTPVTGLKNYSFEHLDSQVKKIDKVVSNASLTDETLQVLSYQMKEINSYLEGKANERFYFKHVDPYNAFLYNYQEFFTLNVGNLGLHKYDPDFYFFEDGTQKDYDFTSDESVVGLARCLRMDINIRKGMSFYDTLFVIGHELYHLYQYDNGFIEKGSSGDDWTEQQADIYGHNMAKWYCCQLSRVCPWFFNSMSY